ncbi:MAG: glucosaminidase domain-containing protein [Alphaproteobacteria bacterium]|jgi:Bax protein
MSANSSKTVVLLAAAFLTHGALADTSGVISDTSAVSPRAVIAMEPVTESVEVTAQGGLLPAADAETVDQILSEAGFQVASVREGDALVPRLFPTAMPQDMAEIDQVAEKKRIFIMVMLPLVLAANENILSDRVQLLYLKSSVDMGQELSVADEAWLNDLAELYYVDDVDLDTLVARVDVIPPSLVLAQAALESGWGTSRFAHEGNAVFGQRSWNEDDGIVPEARRSDETHVVKSFDGLKDSVLAYLVNLNRHGAYRHLRQIRTALHSENLPLDGWTLAAGLDDYAEEADYIELVRSVIRFNKLSDFDNARLADLAL